MLLRVFPHGGGGAKINLEIAKSATVLELWDMIKERLDADIDPDDYRLMVNGKPLECENAKGEYLKLYSDYRIRGNENVQMFKKANVNDLQEMPNASAKSEPAVTAFATVENIERIEDPELREAVEQIAKEEDDKPTPSGEEDGKENTENKEEDEEAWGKCDRCKRKPGRKCKDCNCFVCGLDTDPNGDKTIICDGYEDLVYCERPFHFGCLDPPLESQPDTEEWFCPSCTKERLAREKKTLTIGQVPSKSAAQSRQASAKTERKWGGGFSCAGVAEKCTTVDKHHRGPVPGVEVGQSWKYRTEVSGAGIHRPLQAGIHSNSQVGALSIVASGGYQDESDKGDEIVYTGEGGRSFEGNTRSSEQCKDQTLTRGNLGLALTCFGYFTKATNAGGDAGEKWQKSKPIRIVRGTSAHKNKKIKYESPYEPEEGYRYDGIYKVVKFWREKSSLHGFYVWRFLLRRDDSAPAPWTAKGKERIRKLGLKMVYPADYDAVTKKGSTKKSGLGGGIKRALDDDDDEDKSLGSAKKAKKHAGYKLSAECLRRIAADARNKQRWDICLEALNKTEDRTELIEQMKIEFPCCVCMELLSKPTTFPCSHNVCGDCLSHLKKTETLCPSCRAPLPLGTEHKDNEVEGEKKEKLEPNENLDFVLNYVVWKPVI